MTHTIIHYIDFSYTLSICKQPIEHHPSGVSMALGGSGSGPGIMATTQLHIGCVCVYMYMCIYIYICVCVYICIICIMYI